MGNSIRHVSFDLYLKLYFEESFFTFLKQMSDEEIRRCYNHGCGKEYNEKENAEDVCINHPGIPVFHDALKGWSCCQRKVTDFTDFLNLEGCTKSKHCNIKAVEAEVNPCDPNEPITYAKKTEHRKPDIKERESRPSDNLPHQRLKSTVLDSLIKALNKHKQCITSIKQDDVNGIVQEGTDCKNNGCNYVYKNESSNSENCLYHPGNPVFHEGYKFWGCCLRRTSDFDEFMKQVGCATGCHVWVLTDEQKKKQVACRFDHYQMGSSVIVSIYAKLCDPEKCFVDANQTSIRAKFVFGYASKFELDLKLHGVIEPEKSSVTYSASKIEIKLKKRDALHWPSLELTSPELTTAEGI